MNPRIGLVTQYYQLQLSAVLSSFCVMGREWVRHAHARLGKYGLVYISPLANAIHWKLSQEQS